MASASLQDKANGTRISRLLVDKGTQAMRKTFDNIHPPATLAAVLATKRTLLLRLKPRIINNSQWDLLYPPPSGNPPDSKTFDVTLLTVLLRNICGLPAPATGWNTMPPDTDRSTEANIARIKFFRNEVYAHVTTTEVDNAKFENLWQKISEALVDLNIPQSELDVLKNGYLGPEEETYVEQLKNWKRSEDECKDILDKMGSNVQEFKQVVEEIRGDVKETHQELKRVAEGTQEILMDLSAKRRKDEKDEEDVKETHQDMKETQRDVKETHQDVKETHQDVKETQRCVKEFIAKESSRKDEKDEEILLQLAKHNFGGKIRSAVKSFHEGSRDWLLKRLDEWFTDQESRVMILTAGPGVGKSVFAGKVCEIYKEMGKLAACHFCKFDDSNLRDPLGMLQSLASQMCDNVEGFKEKLVERLKRPHKVKSLKDAFGVYLHDPLQDLKKTSEAEEPMLIVIDGLDESESDGKSELLDLIADEFSELQDWIKILVTSRPEIPVKEKLKNLNPVEILPDDENNESDLRKYLEFCLPSLADKNTTIPALVEKCQGSFLFAFHVKCELLKRGNLGDLPVDEIENFLPKGIGSVYKKYFDRLQNELKAVNRDIDVFRLLEILVVARGPLPLKFIADVLGMSPDTRAMKKIINEVNEKISALLFVSGDLVTVFHKSVVDWLTSNGYEKHPYTVEEENGNELLWRSCEKEFKEIKRNVVDPKFSNEMKYSIDYGYSHLVACKTKYCQESYTWFVDVAIIHVMLDFYPEDGDRLKASWKEILTQKGGLNRQLRIRLSWNYYESDTLNYLQSVMNTSPKDCFSDEEKTITKYILNKRTWCEKLGGQSEESNNTFLVKLFSCRITCFDISSNKKLVAVGHKDGMITFLKLPELNELGRYSTSSIVACCKFLPETSLLLYGRLDTAVDVKAEKEVPFFCGNVERYSSCAFSPSGQRMVTSSGSEIIKLWDIAEQSLLASLRGGYDVDGCSFSKSGLFITGYRNDYHVDDSLSIWNAITLQRVDGRNRFAKSGKGTHFSFDYFSDDFSVECDNVSRCNGSLQQPTKDIFLSRDGKNVMVYDLQHSLPFAKICHLGYSIATSVSSYQRLRCIFAVFGHCLRIMEPFHSTEVAVSKRFQEYRNCNYNYDDDDDDDDYDDDDEDEDDVQIKLMSIDQDSWLHKYGRMLLVFSIPPDEGKAVSCSSSKSASVVSCSFSPDGSRLATCTTDGFINIWSVHKCQVVQRFCGCGTLAVACWWSECFLMVFCLTVEERAVLSKYPVDKELTIRDAQRKDHALDCTVDKTLQIRHFSDGVLIFKCQDRPIIFFDVHEIEDQRSIKLPTIEEMECFAVSRGGGVFLGAGSGKFRIWRKNVKSPTEYEVSREGIFEDLPVLPKFAVRNCIKGLKCCISIDGMLGVVSLINSDTDRIVFVVVNMNSGDITNYHKDIFYERSFDLLASRTFFAVITPRSLSVMNIKTCRKLACLYEKFHVVVCRHDVVPQPALSPEGDVLAIPEGDGHMVFVRIHVPECRVCQLLYDSW